METDQAGTRRRRSVLLKNTYLSAAGYAIAWIAITAARVLELASYSYRALVITGLMILASLTVFCLIVVFRRRVEPRFVRVMAFFQFLNWLIIFGYLAFFLNEIRLLALFCAFIALIFLIPTTGFRPSFVLALCASVVYTAGAYYQIHFGRQAGSFSIELFFVSMFFCVALFLSLAAETFARQRRALVFAKRKAEDDLEKLAAAKKAADAANVAKSDFLANMSHELRTPLNHIIGFTELVVDKNFGDLNATQEEYLNDVLQSSRHLLSLINDILDLSKVEASKMELEVSDVALKPLLENSLTIIKEKAAKEGIALVTDLEALPETLAVDGRKLKQIVYNLLSNAVKFTAKGGRICLLGACLAPAEVEAAPFSKGEWPPTTTGPNRAANRQWVQISVADTGIGINQENLERIFESFEQVENSVCRKYQGTGLGLALVKRLVELHGGRIWAESKGVGHGSTFRFWLPVRIEDGINPNVA